MKDETIGRVPFATAFYIKKKNKMFMQAAPRADCYFMYRLRNCFISPRSQRESTLALVQPCKRYYSMHEARTMKHEQTLLSPSVTAFLKSSVLYF